MPGEIKLEILFRNAVYVLRSPECERLLAGLDAVPDLGNVTGTLREDLRQALSGVESAVAAPNPFEDESEDPPAPQACKETGPAGAEDEAAACAWCGEAGEAVPMRPGDTEALYVCRTPGCQREGKPATRQYFTTGYR